MLSDKQILDIFDVNNIIKKYPESGQKQVLLVEHAKYGTVVLKVVEKDDERIRREIQILTDNVFENVPCLLEMSTYTTDGKTGLYIFEEYISGEVLRELIIANKLDINEALTLAEAMLSVICQMEDKNIVHRDIKPENIIRRDDGKWFLIDFGIARVLDMKSLTMTGVKMGPHTPGYGAPELFQYSKGDIDSRADLFSLGVVLFEASTGIHPFIKGDELDVNEIWYNTVTIIPDAIEISGDRESQFMGLIQTFMQKHITRRPQNAKKALEWYLSAKQSVRESEE